MHEVVGNGARIPAIGMGTWTLRGADCARLVADALAAGYRHVDTASWYQNEAEVGAGLRASGVARDEVFVTTKVAPQDLGAADFRRSAEASLSALRLDHVDLLLVHWPNPRVPLSETIGALNRAREDGLCRHVGVSNFPTRLLAEAVALPGHPLAVNQVESHPLIDQTKVHAACRRFGMAMVAYCPLSRGGDLFAHPAVAGPARRLGRTPAQVVLRWHTQQDGVVAIPRSSRRERLVENLAVFDFTLEEAEMGAISALRSAHHRICDFDFAPEWDTP